MVKRHISAGDTEPEQGSFQLPSAKEHLFQVTDFIDSNDVDIVLPKLEVVGGDEEGRSLLNRISLDDKWKGFFATRLFLKAIGEPYKGEIDIDTDNWVGKQFYATVVHNESKGKVYANIGEYKFDKMVEQVDTKPDTVKGVDGKEVAWDE